MTAPHVEFTTDADHQYRWRVQAANGRILGHGGEGFHNLADCEHDAELTLRALLDLPGAPNVVDGWLTTRGEARATLG